MCKNRESQPNFAGIGKVWVHHGILTSKLALINVYILIYLIDPWDMW